MESDSSIKPNDQVNLIALCTSHHMVKTAMELRLFRGDIAGFIAEAKAVIPAERLWAALELYGLASNGSLADVRVAIPKLQLELTWKIAKLKVG